MRKFSILNSQFSIVLIAIALVSFGFFGYWLPYHETRGMVSPKSGMDDRFDQVLLKLEGKINDISLFRDNSLISGVKAAGPFTEASAFIVVDTDTGEIIDEQGAQDNLYIASITKIMTAVVALDLVSLDETFVVSQRATEVEPTNMGLIPGQKWSLEELLHGLLMTSSNDTAEAINEGVDLKFGEGTFIQAMNAKAKFLGLTNTSFDNPQGYDGPANYSNAEDLARLSLYIYKNYSNISEIVKKEYQFFPETLTHKQADLINWNGTLGVYPGVYGLKIGNTGKAGKTTIVSAEREGKDIIVVLLGAPGVLERDLWVSQLLDLGFAKQFGLEPVNVTEEQLREKYASWREMVN